MKNIFILFLVGLSYVSIAQNKDSLIVNVESYLITNDIDLARGEFSKISNVDSDYLMALNHFFKETESYSDLRIIVKNITTDNPSRIDDVHKLFNSKLNAPKGSVIDIDYVVSKWSLMMVLLNGNELVLADEEYTELEEYIANFNVTDLNYKRTIFYKNIYNIVMEIIKEEIELGVKLSNENMNIATELMDTNLMVMSDFYYSDFLIQQKDLEGYIDLARKNIELSLKAKELPEYYYEHQFHLIDALMYKKGNDNAVLLILDNLYDNPDYKLMSYSYYLQLVTKSQLESEIMRYVFNKFNVETLPQLCDSMVSHTKNKVVMNDQRLLYSISAQVLYNHEYYLESSVMMQNQINFIKDIYTGDLSKSLALSEVRKVENQKKFEIELEKQKTEKQNLYFLIVFLILVFTIVIVIFQVVKNRKLVVVNNEIEKSDYEKQLLLKEIHHRVKNNFQIITSLLQLQAKDIKDFHALEVIKEGQNRIKSMALIHQKLYEKKGLVIDLNDYVYRLFKDINVMFSNCNVDVSVEIDEDCQIDIDTAIPIGLVLNELITNAFKYAFREGRDNKLVLKLIEGVESNQLIVSDNGDDTSEVNVNKVNSIGLKLVSDLAKQLHGKLEVVKDKGTSFIVIFKETSQRKLTE